MSLPDLGSYRVRYLTCRRNHGFAVLTLSMILIAIVIFASVSYARIQQKRADRIRIDLTYQQAKLDAEIGLDLFYTSLQLSPKTVSEILAKSYDSKLRTEYRASVPVSLTSKVNLQSQLFAYPYADNVIEIVAQVLPPDTGQVVRRIRRLHVIPMSDSNSVGYQLRWLPYSDIDF